MAEVHHQKFGWKPDVPDFRDYDYKSMRMKLEAPSKLPKLIDLRSNLSEVYDQGELGSCTGNAIAAALEFDRNKQKLERFTPSRLFIYYNERVREGTVNEDAGAFIRTGIKSVANDGYCHETSWPYLIDKFKEKPVQQAYNEAKKFKAVSYFRIQTGNLIQMKSCLAAGFPFVLGIALYESFYQADENNGVVSMPSSNLDNMLGGHCILCVGYNDATRKFIIRNSWGPNCGDKGHYYLPYEYLTNPNLADDMWTIRSVI